MNETQRTGQSGTQAVRGGRGNSAGLVGRKGQGTQPVWARRSARTLWATAVLALPLAGMLMQPGAAMAQTAPAVKEQHLYGTSQWSAFPIQHPEADARPSFDDQYASMTGRFAVHGDNSWTFGALQHTDLAAIKQAAIEIRFYQTGWQDGATSTSKSGSGGTQGDGSKGKANDSLILEYTTDNWSTAHQLAAYTVSNPPPASPTTARFSGLEGVINAPDKANQVQVRLRVVRANDPLSLTLNVDQVRLVVAGS